MPRVSVILPIYNRAATLERCVRSVLAQTFTDFELLAVDDASTDDSVAACERFGDPRIQVLRHAANRGPSAARNTALRAARGELVALIDSDDEWLPGKLAAQIALLDRDGAGLCGCEYFLRDGGKDRHVRLPHPASWEVYLHARCDLGNGTTLLARRAVIEQAGLLDETLRLYEDWDWVLRLAAQAALAIVHEPLAIVHAGGARPAVLVARSAERFLAQHDAAFARVGSRHRRFVRGQHFQLVAVNAFDRRHYALGCRYLLKSFLADPVQNPLRLAALVLAPIDAMCGTALIQRLAAWHRQLAGS